MPAAPHPLDLQALLAAGVACSALHSALAAVSAARLATQRNVSWFVNFWGWYYVTDALLRTVLPALLLAGAVGVWTRRRFGVRWTVASAGGLVALGTVELAVSLAGFFSGPPRPSELAGVLLSIGQTFVNRYGLLILLVYVLMRPVARRERGETP